jgi:hypothetical protein
MQQRRGTAAQWTAANPTLAAGEIGFETDTSKFKIGNGSSNWAALTYFANANDLTAIIDGAPAALNTLNELAAALNDDPGFVTTLSTNSTNHINSGIDVHGIADTQALATQDDITDAIAGIETDYSTLAGTGLDWNSEEERFDIDNTVATETYADGAVTTHNSATTSVHGIADTSALANTSYVDTAEADAKSYADSEISTHNSDTTNVHGIADTSILVTTTGTQTLTNKTITSPAGLVKGDVGLGNVDNTSDANKPVSTATVTAIATAKSEAIADATAQVTAVLDGAPGALDTLNELAAALGDDANFAGTLTTNLGLKVDSLTPISQKTDSYTLSSLTERDDLIEMGKATAQTLTIPLNATVAFPVGTSLDILQTGAGQVTIAGAVGVTVNATPGLKLRTQWSSATLFKRAENTWVVYGDLTA